MMAVSELVGLMLVRFGGGDGISRFAFSRADAPGEHHLQVQCAWRLCRAATVITGSCDWYMPVDLCGSYDENWDPARGGTLQEVRLRELLAGYGPSERLEFPYNELLDVKCAVLAGTGDLTIELIGGLSLQVFPTRSRGEAWRVSGADAIEPDFVWPPPEGKLALPFQI